MPEQTLVILKPALLEISPDAPEPGAHSASVYIADAAQSPADTVRSRALRACGPAAASRCGRAHHRRFSLRCRASFWMRRSDGHPRPLAAGDTLRAVRLAAPLVLDPLRNDLHIVRTCGRGTARTADEALPMSGTLTRRRARARMRTRSARLCPLTARRPRAGEQHREDPKEWPRRRLFPPRNVTGTSARDWWITS